MAFFLNHILFLEDFFFFLMYTIPFLKSSLNLIQYRLCFTFLFFGPDACGILAIQNWFKPTLPALEGEALTTGLSGKSLKQHILLKDDTPAKNGKSDFLFFFGS